MSEQRKAHYHTFGCKLNFAETATVARLFEEHGIRTADTRAGETPDIVVVNTCSVTEEADRKCRRAIRSFHKRWPGAAILVTGCYAQLKAAEAASLPGVAVVAGTNGKLDLLRYLESYDSSAGTAAVTDAPEAKGLTAFMPSCSRGDRTRYFLKVQDGCDYWCSYCTIPIARGRSRSGSIDQLVALAEGVAAEGGKEIVLTGVNIGDFGKGRADSFFDLVKALDAVDGIERYRISSIEPNLLTDEIIDYTARSRRFMPHFHVPLQSGSDAVLSLMRRRYDTAFFRRKIERIREAMPDSFIGVDLMVGARGETADEFLASKAFVESIDLSHLHVFPYSERPGTRALTLEAEVVAQDEKHRRAAQMIAVSAAKHAAFASRFLGTVRPVLLEHRAKGRRMAGFTDNYLRVEVDAHPLLDNKVVNVRLDSLQADGETLNGTIITEL
ncbi:MAG: tRNA (N(6)-L-threonylcarbamoyladenosine(37)-C(2))-methylthiotransferase MtaB [Muribaculaceae bacterium]|nr:tRNA (N(6)-L-threonylcarbamoyladenosine(37)-C(2))-methylthiotransferase MtaB [Muribaculaceae bacterium]